MKEKLIKILSRVPDFLNLAAGACLVGMMLLTCADVIGGVFGYPILGTEDLVKLMAAMVMALALPATHIKKAHAVVDLFYKDFSPLVKRITDSITSLVSSILFMLIAWQCFLYSNELQGKGQVTATIKFPFAFLLYGVAFSCFVVGVIIFIEFIKCIRGKHNE